jgi:hypothetical protein
MDMDAMGQARCRAGARAKGTHTGGIVQWRLGGRPHTGGQSMGE